MFNNYDFDFILWNVNEHKFDEFIENWEFKRYEIMLGKLNYDIRKFIQPQRMGKNYFKNEFRKALHKKINILNNLTTTI